MDIEAIKEKVLEHLGGIELSQLCLFELERYVEIVEKVSMIGEVNRCFDAMTAIAERAPMGNGGFGLGGDVGAQL